MRISIVTPVWNDPRVARAIKSIRGQKRIDDVEVIVIDGGSGPETQEVLASIRGMIDILVSEPDKGIYDAMNKGVKLATGEIVGILNADDRYQDSDVLAKVVKSFNDDAVDLVYGDLVFVDDDNQVRRYWKSGEPAAWKFWFGWVPPHPTVFVRKRVYEQVGPFNLHFRIAADYEFLLRTMKGHAMKAHYLPHVLVRMALGGTSTAGLRAVWKGNREVRHAWRGLGLSGGWLVMFLKPASKLLQLVRKPPAGT